MPRCTRATWTSSTLLHDGAMDAKAQQFLLCDGQDPFVDLILWLDTLTGKRVSCYL